MLDLSLDTAGLKAVVTLISLVATIYGFFSERLAAITFGASAAFAMPIGYQTSLMIYGPGGYRFKDFILMGIPLDLILAVLALLLIPYF